jgi:ribosomal protein L11 methyltransferase
VRRRASAAPPGTATRVPFLEVHLALADRDPEPIERALFESGALAVTLKDAGDTPILEPAPGATPLWPSIALTALYADGTDPGALVARLRARLAAPELEFRSSRLEDRPWEREWLKDFRPMRFGRRLWICPGGQLPPRDAVAGETPLIVWLDPGLAFGTGTHPTTALCLEWLDAAALGGRRILDVGCGSGVLAIAALKLGARAALAVDIDPQALIATADNAARNGIGAALEVRPADGDWGEPCEVLLANILAEPLIALASRFGGATRPGAELVLSGLLPEQAAAVTAACRPWFDMDIAREREGWVGLVGRRR